MVDCGGIGVVGCGLWWYGGSRLSLVGLLGGSSGSACVVDGGSMVFFF